MCIYIYPSLTNEPSLKEGRKEMERRIVWNKMEREKRDGNGMVMKMENIKQ
jgi:hypothetical protein